ncbi:MAG: TldD/PmbA family protein [Candidatus Heimdallarchaeota archaeon]|nr:TldD/PmbA family protein [Candidatus Heimdallarchaeota archaeon]MBY8993235.1 TldD/PmbA family protein [Candidatus Heimdallarchaeota archaeon]
MRDLLKIAIDNRPDGVHVEARYHQRKKIEVRADKGRLQRSIVDDFAGIGIRVLAEGAWGYGSTSELNNKAVKETLLNAVAAAKNLAPSMKEKIELAPIKPVTGTFQSIGKDPFANHSIEERVNLVMNTDKLLRETDEKIKGSMVFLREPTNHRIIMNSDGTDVELFDSRPDFYVQATAAEAGKMMPFYSVSGMTGGWEIFKKFTPEDMVKEAAEKSIALLDAPLAKGGKQTVIMEPSVVGIISHEAIGHTVESDFVLAGSAAKGKIGKKVGSELVTMVDSGEQKNAGGWLAVDDAGVKSEKTVIIDKGIMKSFLHSRFTAHHFGVKPTGNERAWEYDNEPLIRMRNTYLEPGDFTKEELLEDVKFGYLLAQPGGGQADSTAEFMFSISEAYEIKDGELNGLVKNVTISGDAFEVLQSVTGIGKDWKLDMSAGRCGKWQPAKVDGGGGPTKAIALVSGDVGGK